MGMRGSGSLILLMPSSDQDERAKRAAWMGVARAEMVMEYIA